MIKRKLSSKLKALADKYPVITLTGPRQSGKTTLVKHLFPDLPYLSFEDMDTRNLASNDPRGFLKQFDKGAIFDEVHNVPELFSYLQGVVDDSGDKKFILTGSQNFLMLEKVSQSLAGRTAILKLLPFSLEELMTEGIQPESLEKFLFTGCYPRIFDKEIEPSEFYPFYIQTYIERDVRQIINLQDLSSFSKFVSLCAGRVGQVLNVSSIASDCGVSPNTAKSWLSVLEAGYIISLIQPYYNNFSKRLIKSPKLYFYDTGLVCSLLNIEKAEQLNNHFLKGAIFENFFFAEWVKHRLNQARNPNCYFWRDNHGREIDFILEKEGLVKSIELKSSYTWHSSFFDNLKFWQKLSNNKPQDSYLVYAGDFNQDLPDGMLRSWLDMDGIF
jgi:predicted AAA+ superfamily ATPase